MAAPAGWCRRHTQGSSKLHASSHARGEFVDGSFARKCVQVKDSFLSVVALDKTPAYEKLNGPTGVCQSKATPAELLILFD